MLLRADYGLLIIERDTIPALDPILWLTVMLFAVLLVAALIMEQR